MFGVVIRLMSVVMLNAELARVYNALKLQSDAVVGAAVDWTVIDFVVNAIGMLRQVSWRGIADAEQPVAMGHRPDLEPG